MSIKSTAAAIFLLSATNYCLAIDVTTYSELCSYDSSPLGQIATVADPNMKISGDFKLYDYDFYGHGADNGIVIGCPADGKFWVRQFTYNLQHPIELDWFQLQNNADITTLLQNLSHDISNPGGPKALYVKAPSIARTLVAHYTNWGSLSLKQFAFYESSAPVTIKHVSDSAIAGSKYKLWEFKNYDKVIVGGTNLNLTFQSEHPGLGTGDTNQGMGLLDFFLDSGYTTADLVDFRANVRDTHTSGLNFDGTQLTANATADSTVGRVKQVNISGLFWNSGTRIIGGVSTVWYDPDHFKISDPYAVAWGWDGQIATPAVAAEAQGRQLGCYSKARYQPRVRGGQTLQVDHVLGGVTLEYGTPSMPIFVVRHIGASATEPFVIKYKDIGATGPGTGYPAGVAMKQGDIDYGLIKHDPLTEYGHTSADFRFIKIEQLPSDYGNGVYGRQLVGCADSANAGFGGRVYLWRAEATSENSEDLYSYVTAFVDVTFSNITPWQFHPDGSYYQPAGSGPFLSPDRLHDDRTYGHIIRASAGSTLPGKAFLLDHDTVTGEGSWTDIGIFPILGKFKNTQVAVTAVDNVVRDTTVTGIIRVGVGANGEQYAAPTTGTQVTNVEWTCNTSIANDCTRSVLQISRGADVHATNVHAPAGTKVVELANSNFPSSPAVFYLDGVQKTLPYVFP